MNKQHGKAAVALILALIGLTLSFGAVANGGNGGGGTLPPAPCSGC
jgi:hypothetical protein